MNWQINLVKGFNKEISIQASQMRIVKDNIKRTERHFILFEASKMLYREVYFIFCKWYMKRINHYVTIQSDGSISILRDNLEENLIFLGTKLTKVHVKKRQDTLDNVYIRFLMWYCFESSY